MCPPLRASAVLVCLLLLACAPAAPGRLAAQTPPQLPRPTAAPGLSTPGIAWHHRRPDGVRSAAIEGRPWQVGSPFQLALQWPQGFAARQWSTADVTLFIVAGTLRLGEPGAAAEAARAYGAGSYLRVPARWAHALEATATTLVIVQGIGPFVFVPVDH
jgi:hypothetical protein